MCKASLISQPFISLISLENSHLGKVFLHTKKLLCPYHSLLIHKSSFLGFCGSFSSLTNCIFGFFPYNFSLLCVYICLSAFLNNGACSNYLPSQLSFIIPCSPFCLSCGQLLLLSLWRELFLNRYSIGTLHTFAPGGHSQRYPPYWLIQRAPWPQGFDWHSFRSTH